MASAKDHNTDGITVRVEAETLDPLSGVVIDGRFRLAELIGMGAMGRVYRAVQLPLNRPVALKVLDSRYGAGREASFRQRFLVEAALTARLVHPNTVRVLDYGSTKEGLYYLAMEFLEGESLDKRLARGPLSWRRALNIGQQVARALREAHELGVVHRDLKPGNVQLLDLDDDTDHVKVLDFGLVKSFVEGRELEGRAVTQQGMLMGSPPYMAPEQGEGNRADPRSDIYSLGIVLYEALTGRAPFRGGGPLEIILKHVHEKVPPLVTPSGLEPLPAAFEAMVLKCLAKSPMDRFQSMDEVLLALQEVAPATPTPAVETPSVEVLLPPPRRRPVLLALSFLLAMAAGLGATALVLRHMAPAEPLLPTAAEPALPAPDAKPLEAPQPPRAVLFHIESVPSGATVLLSGEPLGVTPLDVERPEGADGRTFLEVTLSKAGFLPMTATAGGSGQRIELLQKLQPLPEPTARPPASLEPPSVKVVRPASSGARKTPQPKVRRAKDAQVEDEPPAPVQTRSPSKLEEEPELPAATELKRPGPD